MAIAYRINLDSSQEVGTGSTSTGRGYGAVVFDPIAITASYWLSIGGLDFGPLLNSGVQSTPDPNDNVTLAHVHQAARGANGGVVFDILPLASNDDTDNFVSVLNPDGSALFSGIWDADDPSNPLLGNLAAGLAATPLGTDANLYFNFHTTQFPGGAIRGQWVAIADENDNVVWGTPDADMLPGLGGNDTINGGLGADVIFGGLGNDFISGDGTGVGGDLGDWLEGNEGNDWISGGAGNDRMDGGIGNDILDGQLGADFMFGNDGDDIFIVDDAGDIVFENAGQGADIVYASVHHSLSGNVENLVLQGANAINGNGNDAANAIIGNDAANLIGAYGGNDWVEGRGGDDWLTGGSGSDRLDGGAGNDVLQGQGGADALIGGAGADFFMYDHWSDSTIATGFDSIFGFEVGIDKINIAAVHTNPTDTFALTVANGNTYLNVDILGNGSNDMVIEIVGVQNMTNADVLFG